MGTTDTDLGIDLSTDLATDISSSSGEATLSDLVAAAGGTLLYHWEVPLSPSPYITLSGSDVAALIDRTGNSDQVQATASLRPNYNSSGFGTNSLPFIDFPAGSDNLQATVSGLGTTYTRPGFYVVGQLRVSAIIDHLCEWSNGGVSRGLITNFNGSQDLMRLTDSTPTLQTGTISPGSGNAQMYAIRPLASGWLAQVNGTTIASDIGGTGVIATIDKIGFGSHTGTSSAGSSKIWAIFMTSSSEDAIDQVIKDYVEAATAISMA